VHGTIDDKVPVRQSISAVAALRQNTDATVDYVELEGIDHLFDQKEDIDMAPMYAFVAKVLGRVQTSLL
jgi:dipeptidyl aminopeptidase/acylaminoacyl peptidase